MKKTAAALTAALMLCLPGCGSAPAESTASSAAETAQSTAQSENTEASPENIKETGGTAVTFTDSEGREVTVENPQRVAVLTGSFADIFCTAGGKDLLAAAPNDTWTSFDLGLGDEVVNLGAIKEPSVELLLGAEPDLVLASSNTAADLELLPTLEKAGINTAFFDVQCFEDYLSMLDICTQITGCRENYETYGTALQGRIDAAIARQDGSSPTVLCVRAAGSKVAVKGSKDYLLGEMLADLGCVNVADSDAGLLENLSMEAIMADDPDDIFIVVQGSDPTEAQKALEDTLLGNPAWATLRAVQEGRCYTLDNSLYNLKPNARWGEAYEKLADILYPQA